MLQFRFCLLLLSHYSLLSARLSSCITVPHCCKMTHGSIFFFMSTGQSSVHVLHHSITQLILMALTQWKRFFWYEQNLEHLGNSVCLCDILVEICTFLKTCLFRLETCTKDSMSCSVLEISLNTWILFYITHWCYVMALI